MSTDYSKTYIYKIYCKDPNISDCYVGYTINLSRRKSQHKISCYDEKSRKYNYKVYEFIRANGGWNNWNVETIEQCSFNNRKEASQRERYWYDTLKPSLNYQVPNQTICEYIKMWNKKNPEKYKSNYTKANTKYQKENYEKLNQIHQCECGGSYSHKNKSTHLKTYKHIKYLVDQNNIISC